MKKRLCVYMAIIFVIAAFLFYMFRGEYSKGWSWRGDVEYKTNSWLSANRDFPKLYPTLPFTDGYFYEVTDSYFSTYFIHGRVDGHYMGNIILSHTRTKTLDDIRPGYDTLSNNTAKYIGPKMPNEFLKDVNMSLPESQIANDEIWYFVRTNEDNIQHTYVYGSKCSYLYVITRTGRR